MYKRLYTKQTRFLFKSIQKESMDCISMGEDMKMKVIKKEMKTGVVYTKYSLIENMQCLKKIKKDVLAFFKSKGIIDIVDLDLTLNIEALGRRCKND